jgi:outer membrane receptor protein involved in Fe transport
MKISIAPFAVTVLAATWSIGALAAPESEEEALALAYGDKDTVSIATGNSQTLRRAPSVASVITAEDIAAMGATDLDQVMETVPGVHVSQFVTHNISSYQIRGITGNASNPQVLILQNGVPMNTLYRGDTGEECISQPLENVARIEIIRGPGSALYGADAFSGVVNVITKKAADTQGTEFGVRGGSFNTRNAWVQHGGKWGQADVAAYLNVGSTDGSKQIISADAGRLHGATDAPGPENNGYDSIDGSFNLAYDKYRLNIGYKLRDNAGTGAGAASALDPIGKEKSERISADLSWDDPYFAKNWGLGYTGSYLHYAEESTNLYIYPPGATFPTGVFQNGEIASPGRSELQARVSGFATYSGFSGHNLRLGLGHDNLNLYKEKTFRNYVIGTTPGPLFGVPNPDLAFNGGEVVDTSSQQPHVTTHDRKIDYLYAQDEWHLARDWMLTAGVRHDNYSDFGSTTNPRLAMVWDATLDFTAKLLYGQAFRAPSFNELYGVNPNSNGNPNLNPETIKTLEAAFSWQARTDTQVNLNVFRYDMKDVIRSVQNAIIGTGSVFQNTGKQHGSGLELEAAWDASRTVRLTGNYAYQKSIDEATNQDAGYAPHNHIYLRGDWRFADGWLSSAQVNRVMDRMRPAGDIRPPVPDYTTVDTTVHTNRSKSQWECAASVHNLFNATGLEPSLAPGTVIPNDLPIAPRSMWLQVMHQL